MRDEDKIIILAYWIENPEKILRVPAGLSDHVSEKDTLKLLRESNQHGEGGLKSFPVFLDRLRKKVADEQDLSIKREDLAIKKEDFNINRSLRDISQRQSLISEKQSRIGWIQLYIGVFTVLVAIIACGGTLFLSNKQLVLSERQTEILDAQTEILNSSSSPYEPKIQIVPNPNDLILLSWHIADSRSVGDSFPVNRRWAEIDLEFHNIGRSDTKHVFCSVEMGSGELFGYITPSDNFANIPGGSSESVVLHVAYLPCIDDVSKCRSEFVPLGEQVVSLECDCKGCIEQREFTYNISFCVFGGLNDSCSDYE